MLPHSAAEGVQIPCELLSQLLQHGEGIDKEKWAEVYRANGCGEPIEAMGQSEFEGFE